MNTQVAWSGVRERVIAVEEAERRARGLEPLSCPLFEPVLTLAEISEAEAQFGVTLPEEYRTFLAEVGAGGPGPGRLSPLCRIDGTWGWLWDTAGHHWVLDPSGPFVETEGWADQQGATLRAAGYEPTVQDEDTDYLDDYQEAFGDAGEEAWHLERDRGAILISDHGCGMTGWLVIVRPAPRRTARPGLRDQPALRAVPRREGLPPHLPHLVPRMA